MSLPAVVEHLRVALGAALPCPVATIGGAFNGEELRRHVLEAPVALLALTQVGQYKPTAQRWRADLTCSVYLLTRDTPEATRHDQALSLLDALLDFARSGGVYANTRFSLTRPDATSVTAENLYSGPIDSVAVALWGVRWRAHLVLHPEPTP